MMKMKTNVTGLGSKQLELLSREEIEAFFKKSRQWELAPTLSMGGSVIFPHTLIRTCGDQVAATVLGCLDSGADRVIALGVLHTLDREHIRSARIKALKGEDISKEACWGISGPYFPGDQTWKAEYSLQNFKFLWDYEVEKRGLKNPPELILAYICLANKEPWKLPGMEQLKSYLPNSIIVGTTDFCHYGKAYNTPPEQILPISVEAEQFSRSTIEQGLKFFARQSYSDYLQYCYETNSDGSDVGQVLMYLKGPLKAHILETKLIDVASLFEGNPEPSWVAASLIQMTPT